MHNKLTLLAWILALSTWLAWAEEAKEVSVAEAKAVATLLSELADEDFGVRESAEERLKKLHPKILPLVKENLKQSTDTEVQVRGDRVLKALALEGEANPEELARMAKEEALAKRFEAASKFYAKAAERYGQQAESAGEDASKKSLLAKSEKAAGRKLRAAALAQIQKGGEKQAGLRGGRMVIRVGAGAAGGDMVVRMGGEGDEAGDEKADW